MKRAILFVLFVAVACMAGYGVLRRTAGDELDRVRAAGAETARWFATHMADMQRRNATDLSEQERADLSKENAQDLKEKLEGISFGWRVM
jgi:hypothetical protein